MAFHDDVDDANDADDKTSSEHEFENLFPPHAETANTANGVKPQPEDDSIAGAFDLDSALADFDNDEPLPGEQSPVDESPVFDLSSAAEDSEPAPIDLNQEFQNSHEPALESATDAETPPWALAPAPDPNQAVPRLDAPDGLTDEQRAVVSEPGPTTPAPPSSTSEKAPSAEDPYQIPSDYIEPDYFAARVRSRLDAQPARPSDDESAVQSEHSVDSQPHDDTAGSNSASTTDSTTNTASSPSEEFIVEGAPMWNVDGNSSGTPQEPVNSDKVETGAAAASSEEAAADVPERPIRRSMPDDELLTWVDNPENQSTGTLSVIEVLEAQLRLREEEAREYREWETTVREKAGPVADEVIQQVRPQFADVVDTQSAESASSFESQRQSEPGDQEEALAAAPAPTSIPDATVEPPSAVGEPEPEFPQPVKAASLPAWEVPPPSDTWAPVDDFDDDIPFAAHADPTGSITLPTEDDLSGVSAAQAPESGSAAFRETTESSYGDSAAPDEAHERELSIVDSVGTTKHTDTHENVESPVDVFAAVEPPTPDVDSADSSAFEAPVRSEPEPEPESKPKPELEPESRPRSVEESDEPKLLSLDDSDLPPSPRYPEATEADDDQIPFVPPPLVEPEAAPTTPRSDLDEHVAFGEFGFAPPHTSAPGDEPAAVDGAEASTKPHAPVESELSAEPAGALGDQSLAEGSPAENSPATVGESSGPSSAFNFASSETPRYVRPAPLSFDELLSPAPELDDHDTSVDDENPLDALLAGHPGEYRGDPLAPVTTGSIPVNSAAFEDELEDAVDDSDREISRLPEPSPVSAADAGAMPFATAAVASGGLPTPTSNFGADAAVADAGSRAVEMPQPMSLSTARANQQPLGLEEAAPRPPRVFSLEESGIAPTPLEHRVGHAARLFWLWFAANSSIVSIGLGAVVFAVGMSLRQSIIAILAGIALSFIPLGLTTIVSKRTGQPTMVVSRSTFGVVGNIVPATIAVVARLFWGAVLLWLLASSIVIILVGSGLNAGLGDRQLLLLALAVSFLVTLVIAFAGYPLFARIQLVLSIVSGVLIVGLIALTAQYVDIAQALTTPDSSWLLTVTGAVLVFSFVGLVWAYSGGDLARYQRPSSNGPTSMLSASFGATLPAFVLIAYGALLAASDPALARGFLTSPLDTLLLLLPSWYPIPLILAAALSLLSGVTLSLYSGGLALQAVGVRLPRQWTTVIVGVLLGGLAVLFSFGIGGGINELFRDVATTLAVPTAAWAGLFGAETMIRRRRLDSGSLVTRGGIYADVRWTNLSALIVISVIGFALTSATVQWLSWQGYGFEALGVDLDSELAHTDLGVVVALLLGILTPIVAGIPAIRRQEVAQAERVPQRA